MKKHRTDIIILSVSLFVVFVVWLTTEGQEPINIQMHDTYYVIDKTSMAALILTLVTFVIFLVRATVYRFKLIGANVGLIIGLILFTLLTFAWAEMLESDLTHAKATTDAYTAEFVSYTKGSVLMTWALFGFWTICIGLLILQTGRLLKKYLASH